MKCDRCAKAIDERSSYAWHGQTVCEDCYLDLMNPPKACDPAAVYLAKRTREQFGFSEAEGLTEAQRKVYDRVKHKGKVTKEELTEHTGLSTNEIDRILAVLRHCELTRGCKEGNVVYVTLFKGNSPEQHD